jgi:hypothetical protein
MSKNQMIMGVFNKKLMEFVKEVIEMYPDNKDFKSMRSQLRMIMSSAENLPIQKFKELVTIPYSKKIYEKEDLSGTPFESFNYLKKMWKTTTPTTKEAMWKYVELLTKLSEKFQ